MTKKANEERVAVHHPEQKATANPLRSELKKWEAAGWIVTQTNKPETETKA